MRSRRPGRGSRTRSVRREDMSDQLAAFDDASDVHAARSTQHAASYPGESPDAALSISVLTRTAKDVLEGAFVPLWVRGEVCDFKAHRNGHWYFCLRDGSAQIRCVVWSRDQRWIPAPPDDGMEIVALGQLTVYTTRGDLQLSVRRMAADGDGLWRKALAATVARLSAEGLLAPERKREVPRHPSRIAVVTSRDGAALHDIVAVVRRRCPMVEIVLAPARVQGDGAPEELCAAIERATRWGRADTLIIGRGGGGREDLWAFNDERVARALAASPIPTISAVGHEIDVTVCDLVADLRAATPSAAAEAAVPSRQALRAELRHLGEGLTQAMAARLGDSRRGVALARRDLAAGARGVVDRRRMRLQRVAGALNALSPLAVLARGYAVAQDHTGRTLSSVADFDPGQGFRLVVRDGTIAATVNSGSSTDEAAEIPRSARDDRHAGHPEDHERSEGDEGSASTQSDPSPAARDDGESTQPKDT